MTITINFILLVCAFAGIYQVVALIAGLRHLRRREPAAAFTPPISVLKPVRGLDPGFYEAIRSHATQDYQEFELLFGV
ncbi:MAG TPA: glycosyl transferase, partial [Candidatus Sulfotelmatobacter sp.]|nr:glycosyl transferase [Candidatus Sulfotelmatobacter sp.]